jgi:hypothetical protein
MGPSPLGPVPSNLGILITSFPFHNAVLLNGFLDLVDYFALDTGNIGCLAGSAISVNLRAMGTNFSAG